MSVDNVRLADFHALEAGVVSTIAPHDENIRNSDLAMSRGPLQKQPKSWVMAITSRIPYADRQRIDHQLKH
jgi:hypothetical protein